MFIYDRPWRVLSPDTGAGSGGGAVAPSGDGEGGGEAGGQAPQGGQRQAGTGQRQAAGQVPVQVFDADYVAGLRQEAGEWRTKLRTEEQSHGTTRDALRAARLELAITRAARTLEVDAELATTLLPVGAVEFDNDNQPKDVEAKLKGLLDKFPQLKVTVRRGGETTPANPATRGSGSPQRVLEEGQVTPGLGRLQRAYAQAEARRGRNQQQ